MTRDLKVEIGTFVFSLDFVVLDMSRDDKDYTLFGRPFLDTFGALIDIHKHQIMMRIDNAKYTIQMITPEDKKEEYDRQSKIYIVESDCDSSETPMPDYGKGFD
ncbi:unnamed protein product [Linum trigynum]|uniref:Reverse transcriptase domain-containing protein n=1 Tax=Linum trigynum TaxID=586398 RepID=A0AAV2CKX1_9ROSI